MPLSLINLVGMSVFCVALFDCNILTSFRISTFSTNEKLKLDSEVVFFDDNKTRMGPMLHNGFNDWITDIFCLVNLIKLWNVKIRYDIRKGFIQNFDSFCITPYNILLFYCLDVRKNSTFAILLTMIKPEFTSVAIG